MNKDYAKIEIVTGICVSVINSHAEPIPLSGYEMIEYNSTTENPIGKKREGQNWVDVPALPPPPKPTFAALKAKLQTGQDLSADEKQYIDDIHYEQKVDELIAMGKT